MTPDKISGDAIFIKLGWLEVSAIGRFGIAVVAVLLLVYFGTRLILRLRKG